jgi:hypothetical protein
VDGGRMKDEGLGGGGGLSVCVATCVRCNNRLVCIFWSVFCTKWCSLRKLAAYCHFMSSASPVRTATLPGGSGAAVL